MCASKNMESTSQQVLSVPYYCSLWSLPEQVCKHKLEIRSSYSKRRTPNLNSCLCWIKFRFTPDNFKSNKLASETFSGKGYNKKSSKKLKKKRKKVSKENWNTNWAGQSHSWESKAWVGSSLLLLLGWRLSLLLLETHLLRVWILQRLHKNSCFRPSFPDNAIWIYHRGLHCDIVGAKDHKV